jgi:hypothetical protein
MAIGHQAQYQASLRHRARLVGTGTINAPKRLYCREVAHHRIMIGQAASYASFAYP